MKLSPTWVALMSIAAAVTAFSFALTPGCIELQQMLYSPNPNSNTIHFFNENESDDNDNDNTDNGNDNEDNENTPPSNGNTEPNENDNVEPNDNEEPQNLNDNTGDGIPPLPDGVVLVPTSSGLQIAEIVTGSGEFASLEAAIVVNYMGWVLDTEVLFDSGEGVSFVLGGLIEGWQEGVLTMQPGGKRRLVIPADLAYGAAGRPPLIPPNATLVFDIELIDVL